MPNLGCAGQNKRRLLQAKVEDSKILYGVPVWFEALVHKRNIDTILRPQRVISIRTVMAYRTISTVAAMVVAGLFSAHLLAWERTERFRRRSEQGNDQVTKEIREDVIWRWQVEWDGGQNSRWTRRLINDLNASLCDGSMERWIST